VNTVLPMRGVACIARCWLGVLSLALLACAMLWWSAARAQDEAETETLNLVGHGGPVRGLSISADGERALSASFDYSVILWDLTGRPPKLVKRLIGHEGPVNAAAFLPGGRALTGSDDGTLAIWDLALGEIEHRLRGHTAKILDIAVSPDGKLAASASWDHTVGLWRLPEAKRIALLKGHAGPVNTVSFAGDGKRFYSGGYDGTVRLWRTDGASAQAARPVVEYGWGINVLRPLLDGRIAFGAQNGDVRVVQSKSGDEIKILAPHEGPVLALALSPERDLLATGGADGVIRLWRTDNWAAGESYANPTGPVWALAFKTRGQVYYGGLDDFVIHWSADPRLPFETVPSTYPRRFQVSGEMSLGERQFARKCSVCHTLTPEDANRAGPTLYGIFGREAGSLPEYPYSEGLKKSDIVWNEETIAKLFGLGPDHVTPGSKMPLQVIQEAEKRKALVAFLKKATRAKDGEAREDENKNKEE